MMKEVSHDKFFIKQCCGFLDGTATCIVGSLIALSHSTAELNRLFYSDKNSS